MGVLKIPRITTAQRTALTLDIGELVHDTDEDAIYRGDGATVGGVEMASGGSGLTEAEVTAIAIKYSIALG